MDGFMFMMFNAIFNNISVILVKEPMSTWWKLPTCLKSLTSFIT